MTRQLSRACVRFLFAALGLMAQAYGQQLATLNVTVNDPTGSSVAQARVTLTNRDTGAKRSELSTATGLTVIPGLPAGSYQLAVESDQFSAYHAPLTLTVGQYASLAVTLGMKAVHESVDVQETVQGVDTQKSEVSQVIDSRKIADLPIPGRDFSDFVVLTRWDGLWPIPATSSRTGRSRSKPRNFRHQGSLSMAHIELPEGLPGIRGPLVFSPVTTRPLCDLVELLLHGPNALTPAEREMIATYVSSQNDCYYCQTSHGSTAAQHLGGTQAEYDLISQIKRNFKATPISEKMKALLAIAGKVQKGGKYVTAEDVERARLQGANDKEIHDTVLIAAAFCMFNRYVDGLGTWQPRDPELYREIGKQTARLGYAARDWKQLLPISAK